MNAPVRDPPGEAPPPYTRAVAWAPPRSLAPIQIVMTTIACIWALIVGISHLRDLGDEGETAKLKALDIVYAILCFVIAGLQGIGFVAGVSGRLPLIKLYSKVALLNVVLLIGVGVVALVFHFIAKTDSINQCIIINRGDLDDNGIPLTNTNISDYCNSRWNRGIFYDVAWLIALIVFALFSASIAAAFFHQAKNPAFNRTQAPSGAFQMNPYGQEPQFAPPMFAPPTGYPPAPDYKNEPPQYNYGEQWQGGLAEKPDTPGYQTTPTPQHQEAGFPVSHPNDSTGTLRAVDFRDEDNAAGRPRRENDNVV